MEKEIKNIYEKLSEIQNELKAPKNQYNAFGKYYYRNAEDILEAAKPICKKHRTTLIVSDDLTVKGEHDIHIYVENIWDKEAKELKEESRITGGQRYYVETTATLYDWDSEKFILVKASAREEENKKGMDSSQITGASSSYARKYALNGLFNIDDTKDVDSEEFQNTSKSESKKDETKKTTTKATEKQVETIKNLYSEEEQKQVLDIVKREKLENLTVQEASSLISKRKKEDK